MKITVMTEYEEYLPLGVSSDETVKNLKAILQAEIGASPEQQKLMFHGNEMRDNMKLSQIGVRDGDMILMNIQSISSSSSTPSRRSTEVSHTNNLPFRYSSEWKRSVAKNMEAGLEHNPEGFARVTLLYISIHVDNIPLKAFVDTGAQMSTISRACAQRCGILSLMDTRFAGIVRGTGTNVLLGKIHFVPIQFGRFYCPCAFFVLDMAGVDVLLGLDMLRKHSCIVDLKRKVLEVEDGSCIPFLHEKDIPSDFLGKH